ncbi:hypothetical protein ACFSNO_34045, partial [Streptomyces cirratus]
GRSTRGRGSGRRDRVRGHAHPGADRLPRVRFLVARWTGTDIPAGRREAGPVVQLSTGYWWTAFSYEAQSPGRRHGPADAVVGGSDPATWRDLRFAVIAPFSAGVVAALPPAALAVAVLGLARPETVARPETAARTVGACALVLAAG